MKKGIILLLTVTSLLGCSKENKVANAGPAPDPTIVISCPFVISAAVSSSMPIPSRLGEPATSESSRP